MTEPTAERKQQLLDRLEELLDTLDALGTRYATMHIHELRDLRTLLTAADHGVSNHIVAELAAAGIQPAGYLLSATDQTGYVMPITDIPQDADKLLDRAAELNARAAETAEYRPTYGVVALIPIIRPEA